MKKTLAAATVAALFGMAGAANAADLYNSAGLKDGPVFAADAASWTGFYLGAGIGAGFINHDLTYEHTATPNGKPTTVKESGELNGIGGEGVLGTVEVGYDRQYGRFVGGIFFNYDFGDDVKSTASYAARDGSIGGDITLSDTWAVGGRLGYLVNKDTLAYVLGGYTEADVDFSSSGLSKSYTLDGYTVGGGLQTRLTGNWYLKGEYRYSSFEDSTLWSKTNVWGAECHKDYGSSTRQIKDQVDVQSARLVLSYKASLFDASLPTPLK